MEPEAADFQDWELLHNSDTALVNTTTTALLDSPRSPNSVENATTFEGIEGDSEGMIRSDYFSIDSHERYVKSVVSEVDSVESDNPSWIDPGSETRYWRKNSGEFWSDSGSDRSDERKFSDFDGKNEFGFLENVKSQLGFEGIGKMEAGSGNYEKFGSNEDKFSYVEVKNELSSLHNAKFEEGFEEFGEIQTQYENSGGESLDSMSFGGLPKTIEKSEFSGESVGGNGSVVESAGGDEHSIDNKNVVVEAMKPDGVEEKRNITWWKVPLELLKYCVFRVSPVWSVSVAAALMGFLILGTRLYKLKQKSRSLELKVTVDDKKVSQFMSRAARLNEAFSVVRRVPIIRPSVPVAGVTPWPVPVMSLR